MDEPRTMVAPSPATLTRCHRNYVEAYWQYTKSSPGAERRTVGGGTAVGCSVRSALANTWFLMDDAGPLEPAFLEARRFYGPKRPWRVIATGSRVEDVRRLAEGYGMRRGGPEPGMILDPIPPAPPAPAELSVQVVDSRAHLRDFEVAWCRSFGIPRMVFPLVLPDVLRDDPSFGAQSRLVVGYVSGHPVACSSVVVTEGVAGVVSVGTVRSARGHGYGTALTWRAMEEGRTLGASVAFLAASSMGLPVYEKMGFRTFEEYPTWFVPSGFVGQLAMIWGMWRFSRAARRSSPT